MKINPQIMFTISEEKIKKYYERIVKEEGTLVEVENLNEDNDELITEEIYSAKQYMDHGRSIFGPMSQVNFEWKDEYFDSYELFKSDVMNIYNEWKANEKKVNKVIDSLIHTEKKKDKWLHLDELKTSFYFMIFYKIVTEKDGKYLIMELMTFPGYLQDGKDKAINYIMYEQQFYYMNREAYFQYKVKKQNPIFLADAGKIETRTDGRGGYYKPNFTTRIKLTELLRHDFYNNFISAFFDERKLDNKCSAEEAFYFNDFMMYYDGKGRKELSIFDITLDTEDGHYFCFGINPNYEYNVEHDFELVDQQKGGIYEL